MVSSEQFRKPDREEEEPEVHVADVHSNFPLSHDAVVNLLRNTGVVPPWVPDSAVVVTAIRPSTGESHVIGPGYMGRPGVYVEAAVTGEYPSHAHGEWHLDDIFPHTSFDDPPHGKTPQEYKDLLLGVLSESMDLEDFTVRVSAGLGADMVMSHGVPEELAMHACMDFATKIYKEYKGNAQ